MLTSTETNDDLVNSTKEAQNLSGQPQNNQTDTKKQSPLQQRKRDSLELAELIYKIYNENCPVSSKGSVEKENHV